MKKLAFIIFVPIILFMLNGCQDAKSKAAEGAVVGGVLGAAAGGIIGHQGGHGGEGAGIGAAVGAVAGGLIGSQIEKKPAQTTVPNQNPTQETLQNQEVSVLQVIELSKQGTPDDVIIDKINKTNSKFKLSAEDINYLKKQGISQKVIDAMLGAKM